MKLENNLMMIPGPVPIVPRIQRAMGKPMFGHRGEEFGNIYDKSREILSDLFQTINDIFILSGSGTASMEAAIGNVIGSNDTIVTIENGKFGERLCDLGERYGKAVKLQYEWGTPIDLEAVEASLEKGVKAVAMVHNETSAGIKNPAEEVGKLAKKHGALFIMDAITTVGGDTVLVDKWGVDIAFMGSQKCIAAPPGLSAITVSDAAWEAMVDKPPYYLDLKAYRKSAANTPTQTPFTPAVPLFSAMLEALLIVQEEGMEKRRLRHAQGAAAVRTAADALGIELFPKIDKYHSYSNTVTAMNIPDGITDKELRGEMLYMGIQISGGQSHLKGNIFRIGSMGNFTPIDMITTITALELVLKNHGIIDSVGAGVETAKIELDKIDQA
jgi:aspartate aminotransferase-like enzyme